MHITYSSGQTWGQPTQAAAQEVAPLALTAAVATTPTTILSTTSSTEIAYSTSATGSAGSTSTQLTSGDSSKLSKLGVSGPGVNAADSAGGVWLGSDGPYTSEFTNAAGEDLILVVWGPDASWVNVHTPLITVSLSPNDKTTVSFASGSVGAWSAIYGDTQLVNGQVSNTWAEYTMSETGVVDVSREVNMDGHTMSVVGPSCTTDMDRCVFVCSSGNVCTTGYVLQACTPGSQPGAQDGTDGNGGASGGCGGMGSSAALKTTFS